MTNSGGCAPSANTLEADPRAPGRTPGPRDDAAGTATGTVTARTMTETAAEAGAAARGRISRRAGFWLLAGTLLAFMAAASTPSPLYVLYQQRWGFSAATLTAVFAVYALALLIALLTVGGLSDHVGRRPVLIAALLAEAGAMVAFLTADGVGPLLLARAVQGLATGAATGAISAGLVDLQPASRRVRQLGALVNSVAPTGGLAAGALGAGLFVRYTSTPTTSVFVLLTAVFVLLAAAMALLPEPVAPRRGRGRDALVSLRPQVAVPRPVRGAFAAAVPCLIATWALGGLYLSLGGSLTAGVLRVPDRLVGGLVVTALTAAGAVASLVVRDLPPRRVMAGGRWCSPPAPVRPWRRSPPRPRRCSSPGRSWRAAGSAAPSSARSARSRRWRAPPSGPGCSPPSTSSATSPSACPPSRRGSRCRRSACGPRPPCTAARSSSWPSSRRSSVSPASVRPARPEETPRSAP